MTNQSPLISVIVPVYKAETLLHRCVDSILNQTYTNLEIILVDDGSPDRGGAICDEYVVKDSRIWVIHQENAGLSAARNSALDICIGDYICFVDSDDYVLPQMYEKMLSFLLEHQVDICVCQWQCESSDGQRTMDAAEFDHTMLGKKSIREFARYFYKGSYEDVMTVVVWNKLYRADIFKKLRFSGRFMENEVLHTILFIQDYSVYVILVPFYIYCQNEASLTHNPFWEEALRYLSILVERIALYQDAPFIVQKSQTLYCNLYIEYYYKAQNANITMPDILYFREYLQDLVRAKARSVKFIVRMLLFLASPGTYHRLLVQSCT